MRRDRDGSLLDELDEDEWVPHNARCRDGWTGEDDDGRPTPCLLCRPHLANLRTKDTRP